MTTSPQSPARAPEHSVLHFGSGRVSWLARGSASQVHRLDFDARTTELHQAAIRLLAGIKEKRRTCILGLEEGFYRRLQVDLPANVSASELKEVLRRKASGLFGDGVGIVFEALPLQGDRKKIRSGVQPWLVFAVEAGPFRALLKNLTSVGFKVVRTVAADLSYQNLAHHESLGEDQGALLVGHTGASIGVSLFTAKGLVTQNLVPIESLDREALASTLVQELRAMDAYWRKMTEGGSITRATLVGFDRDWEGLITPSARLILPDLDLTVDTAARVASDGLSPSPMSMSACALVSPLAIEFSLKVAPKKRVAVTLAVASVAAVLSVGSYATHKLRDRSDALFSELEMRFDRPYIARTTSSVAAELDSLQREQVELEAEWAAFLRIGTASLALEDTTSLILDALGTEAALESLHVEVEGGLVKLIATAVTPSETARASRAMASTLRRLQSVGDFSDLSVEPDSRIPDPSEDARPLGFVVQGTWSPANAESLDVELHPWM